MRLMLALIVLIILGGAAFVMVSVRTVSHDPEVWHVDPLTVPPSETPNSYRVAPSEFTSYPVGREAPIYLADARTLAQAFDTFVMAQPLVERVAGSVEEGWITYVQRTPVLQMPDYISVRFYDLEPPAPETAPEPSAEGGEPEVPAAGDAPTETQDAVAEVAAPAVVPSATPRATIAVYSRSRFGYGDMGVNEARVTSWLTSLQSFEE